MYVYVSMCVYCDGCMRNTAYAHVAQKNRGDTSSLILSLTLLQNKSMQCVRALQLVCVCVGGGGGGL